MRVSARNLIGYGPAQAANPVAAQPALQIPGKPSSFSGQAQTNSIKVSFSAPFIPAHRVACGGAGSGTGYTEPNPCPSGMGVGTQADGGAAISSYEIQWDTSSAFDSPSAAPHVSSHSFSVGAQVPPFEYTISSLSCTNTYYIRLAALNSQGTGAFCSSSGLKCDGSAIQVQPTC